MRTALRVKFPDHQGKYRDFRDFGCLGVDLQLKKPHLLSGFFEIPYSTEQGIVFE